MALSTIFCTYYVVMLYNTLFYGMGNHTSIELMENLFTENYGLQQQQNEYDMAR